VSRAIDVSVPVHQGMPVYRGNPPVKARRTMTLAREGVTLSEYCLGSHTGTHVDAPIHFIQGGAGIDRLDLDRFHGPAWVADLRRVRKGIGAAALARAGIPRGTRRVLLRTANSRLWHPVRPFRTDFVYLEAEGARWLIERGVRLVGIDYLSIEGFGVQGAPTHHALLGAGIPILEGLDLSRAAPGRYLLSAVPVRWRDADGAPTRAVLWR
jgi:arylformamidase